MDVFDGVILGACVTLVVVFVVYLLFDVLAEREGRGPSGECLRELRWQLRDRRNRDKGSNDARLLTSMTIAVSDGRPATVYLWFDGAPLRVVGYGELREPPAAARMAAHAERLTFGEICRDAYGVLVPLRTRRGRRLVGVLALAPGQPPHPEHARLLVHFGDLLARLSPAAWDCAAVVAWSRCEQAAPDTSAPDVPPPSDTTPDAAAAEH